MARTLYTLSEVSKRTGISMNTLLRYKKLFQDRIPSEGDGRRQRYPKEAFPVFAEIKRENLAKRGKKGAATTRSAKKGAPRRKAAKKRAVAKRRPVAKMRSAATATGKKLLTLRQIADRTKISYGTVARYAKLHAAKIPSEGRGRKRRYPKEAVAVFKEIRGSSKPGRKPAAKQKAVLGKTARKQVSRRESDVTNAALSKRISDVEKTLKGLSKQLEEVLLEVKRPIEVTIGR